MDWFIGAYDTGWIESDGAPTGRFRLHVSNDELSPGLSDMSHDHATLEEAYGCDDCDKFVCEKMGTLTRRARFALKQGNDAAALRSAFAKSGIAAKAKHRG